MGLRDEMEKYEKTRVKRSIIATFTETEDGLTVSTDINATLEDTIALSCSLIEIVAIEGDIDLPELLTQVNTTVILKTKGLL